MLIPEQIISEVKRDIASFADPGCSISITDAGLLTWTKSKTIETARVIRQPGFPDIEYGGRRYLYKSFLASEALADLKDLAESTLSSLPPVDHFVPPTASITKVDGAVEKADAIELVIRYTTERLPATAATRVLFVQGDAGIGKTSILVSATRLQAERFLRGETGTLLLYLDAQGKGLTQLEDVMARALQDLRAKFFYHSVAALTRRQCVVPIVDGFDELIGPSSAREAFANLAQFLSQLDCEGALIVSSRSSFIDYRTLHERAQEVALSTSLSYEVAPVEVERWSDEAVQQYVSALPGEAGELKREVSRWLASPIADLVRVPFFLVKLCDLYESGRPVDFGSDLVRQIVQREVSKLRDPRGTPLLTEDQHWSFCEALAEEMWAEGRPDLDLETIRLIAELVGEEVGLAGRDVKVMVDRSIAHALLTNATGASERRQFNHELFRFEFLASRLAKALSGDRPGLEDFIVRAELPAEVLKRVREYGLRSGDEAAAAIGRVCELATRVRRGPFTSSNAGAIVAALLRKRRGLPAELRFSGLLMRADALGGCELAGAVFSGCQFENTNFEDTVLRDCRFEATPVINCVISTESTHWDGTELSGADVFGLTVVEGGAETETYDPGQIRRYLEAIGVVSLGPVDEPARVPDAAVASRIELVEKLLKHCRTHYYLVPDSDWEKHNLLSHREWNRVQETLKSHGLLVEKKLDKRGPARVFLALTAPADVILQGRAGRSGAPRVREFWEALERQPA